MGYKMFLNDSHFLETHYEDFNMKKIEVGYKFKTKIVPNDVYGCNESQDLYMGLMDIINYKDLNKKNNGKIKSKL